MIFENRLIISILAFAFFLLHFVTASFAAQFKVTLVYDGDKAKENAYFEGFYIINKI
jgi:hypothetical protein